MKLNQFICHIQQSVLCLVLMEENVEEITFVDVWMAGLEIIVKLDEKLHDQLARSHVKMEHAYQLEFVNVKKDGVESFVINVINEETRS